MTSTGLSDSLIPPLPDSWQMALQAETVKPYFQQLLAFLAEEHAAGTVYPPVADIFSALHLTPLPAVKVLLLGQDPYHGEGQAHGLCFSVRAGTRAPASLRNILKELAADQRCAIPAENVSLLPWAERGVLLLNTVLTVRAGQPLSHRARGWEIFTDQIIRTLNDRAQPFVAALWGAQAQEKMHLIDGTRHTILTAAHPSPLSAHRGFLGTRPFTAINTALRAINQAPINWNPGNSCVTAAIGPQS